MYFNYKIIIEIRNLFLNKIIGYLNLEIGIIVEMVRPSKTKYNPFQIVDIYFINLKKPCLFKVENARMKETFVLIRKVTYLKIKIIFFYLKRWKVQKRME